MQLKNFTILAFLATSMAGPMKDSTGNSLAIQERSDTVHAIDATMLAPQKQKQWQAKGGCKRDWDEDDRCKNQCRGEAADKCKGWKSVTTVLTGGCVWGWKTCQCVCEY